MKTLHPNETGTSALDTTLIILFALTVGVLGATINTTLSSSIWSVILVSSLGTLPFIGIARMVVQRKQE
jgi:hypothetical protein